MSSTQDLVLASNSPRRKQLLKAAGFQFTIKVADVDESFPSAMPPEDVAEFLAVHKNDTNREKWGQGEVILTADTTVVVGNEVLNKAANPEEAAAMLEKLSDTFHWVYTGVCISSLAQKTQFSVATKLFVDKLSAAEIDYYIQQYQPFDKAGAYGIQEWFGQTKITRIEGSYSNVVGLPVREVYQQLTEQFGLQVI